MTPAPRSWRIVHSESSPGWGGQEHRILAEMTGFRRRGCTVALLAPAESEIRRRAEAQGLAVEPLPAGRRHFPWALVRIARWLRRQQVQVLNTHSSRDGWLVGLAGRWAKVPLIVRTRHFDVPVPYAWFSRLVYVRLADLVLTTSPRVTARFQELFGLPPERIATVPTGVDLEVFRPAGPALDWNTLGAPAPGRRVGMIAVFRRAKGHACLLAAARQLRHNGFDAHYLLVGEGPQLEAVRRQAAELGLAARVTFPGHREDVADVLRGLDLLAIPSLHEGVPQVALQALACGVPVVGSDTGGIPSVIQPGRTGRLAPPGDPAALAAAIREVFDDPAGTQRMREAGLALVRDRHSLEGMLDTLERLYERGLARALPPKGA